MTTTETGRRAGPDVMGGDAPARRHDDRIAAIYAREGQRLTALGRLLTGSLDAGEDMAQEVFVRALQASARDPEYLQEPAWPWLRTTLVRLVIQRHRSRMREWARLVRSYQPREQTPWPAETMDVADALRALPPRMRACTVLHHCEDLTAAETADVVGCSPATVIVHLRQARARLRARLDPDGEHTRPAPHPSPGGPRRG